MICRGRRALTTSVEERRVVLDDFIDSVLIRDKVLLADPELLARLTHWLSSWVDAKVWTLAAFFDVCIDELSHGNHSQDVGKIYAEWKSPYAAPFCGNKPKVDVDFSPLIHAANKWFSEKRV